MNNFNIVGARPNFMKIAPILENDGGFQLREEVGTYIANFDIKNDDIGAKNAYYWDINHTISIS